MTEYLSLSEKTTQVTGNVPAGSTCASFRGLRWNGGGWVWWNLEVRCLTFGDQGRREKLERIQIWTPKSSSAAVAVLPSTFIRYRYLQNTCDRIHNRTFHKFGSFVSSFCRLQNKPDLLVAGKRVNWGPKKSVRPEEAGNAKLPILLSVPSYGP